MGEICTSLSHSWCSLFQPGPPHSFFWGHIKVFGEAVMATGGKSFELALKQFAEYGPDGVLLYLLLQIALLIQS
jgi:hypothetical protein